MIRADRLLALWAGRAEAAEKRVKELKGRLREEEMRR